jgi:hypothetical protein
MDTITKEDEATERFAGDLLVGAAAINAYLAHFGVPDPDAYYLRRAEKWPIGKNGAHLIASKRRLDRHAQKITAAARDSPRAARMFRRCRVRTAGR